MKHKLDPIESERIKKHRKMEDDVSLYETARLVWVGYTPYYNNHLVTTWGPFHSSCEARRFLIDLVDLPDPKKEHDQTEEHDEANATKEVFNPTVIDMYALHLNEYRVMACPYTIDGYCAPRLCYSCGCATEAHAKDKEELKQNCKAVTFESEMIHASYKFVHLTNDDYKNIVDVNSDDVPQHPTATRGVFWITGSPTVKTRNQIIEQFKPR